MRPLPPLVLIGPSGAGKSAVMKSLVETGRYQAIRTYTTRPKRLGEDDATHFFVSHEEFNALELGGEFEAVTTVFGNRYALPRIGSGESRPVTIVQAEHVPVFRRLHPDCLVVLLIAPVATLVDRIRARGDVERIDILDFEQEIRLGRTYARFVIDTTESIEAATQAIMAGVG